MVCVIDLTVLDFLICRWAGIDGDRIWWFAGFRGWVCVMVFLGGFWALLWIWWLGLLVDLVDSWVSWVCVGWYNIPYCARFLDCRWGGC